MKRTISILACSVLFAFSAVATRAPLVVAIDTSRSLSQQSFRDSLEHLDTILAGLDQDASAGLITFDDQPVWRVPLPASVASVRASLSELSPSGQHTLLNDALFFAAKALPDGGVILLLTDGRDENSAVTVEDFARTADSSGVRVISLATGGTIAERNLRRLALLTNGDYFDRIGERPAEGVASALEENLREAGARPASPTAEPIIATTTEAEARSPATTVEQPSAPGSTGLPWWVVLLALVAGAAVVGWWTSGRKSTQPPTPDALIPDLSELDKPSHPTVEIPPDTNPLLEVEKSSYDTGEFDLDELTKEAPPVATYAEEVQLDPKVFEKTPLEERLEQTFVLEERYVLTVLEEGAAPRSFYLHPDSMFAVGRAPKVNTLTVDDPTLSGQHFRIVPKDGEFFIVDLDTTNGTRVNEKRIRARRLQAGDKIRAGEVEMELKVSLKRSGLGG